MGFTLANKIGVRRTIINEKTRKKNREENRFFCVDPLPCLFVGNDEGLYFTTKLIIFPGMMIFLTMVFPSIQG